MIRKQFKERLLSHLYLKEQECHTVIVLSIHKNNTKSYVTK